MAKGVGKGAEKTDAGTHTGTDKEQVTIIPVILAGGSGSRLWPLSRTAYPKQLLPLINQHTMLQNTILRLEARPGVTVGSPLVICNQEHRFLVAEQLQQIEIKDAAIMLEPTGKNTAPAAAMAALYLREQMNDPLLLVLPADHVIKESDAFMSTVSKAVAQAQEGKLVTFGVKPSHPETGYGYIKTSSEPVRGAYLVEQFVEKPDRATAEQYLQSDHYFWNSGMFMFRASRYLEELSLYAPDMLAACQKTIAKTSQTAGFIRFDEATFSQVRSESIDYAVMEKTKAAVLVPLQSSWSDVGSWTALWDVQDVDANGNVLQGDVMVDEVSDSYLRAESRMLAVVGVKDHIVIETADAVLVAHKDHSQAVKKMVNHLKQQQRVETDLHRKVYRPWGYYETVDKNPGFQVKRITVKPGAHLSLQMHHHRSEHWVVVSGVAQVTRGEEVFTLKENESTYIPAGVKHRLANAGKTNLDIIEVQCGHYLGEDDIVRFEDIYGRVNQVCEV